MEAQGRAGAPAISGVELASRRQPLLTGYPSGATAPATAAAPAALDAESGVAAPIAHTGVHPPEPWSYADYALFVGAVLAAIYLGCRASYSNVSLPVIGEINTTENPAGWLIGAILGLYIGPAFLFRAAESLLDAWRPLSPPPESTENDGCLVRFNRFAYSVFSRELSRNERNIRQRYKTRFMLMRCIPPVVSVAAMVLINTTDRTDGLGIFRPEVFTTFPTFEKTLTTGVYAAFVAGTLANRLGTFIDVIRNRPPWKKILWADIGLFAGIFLMPFYITAKMLLGNTVIVPIAGVTDSSSVGEQAVTGTGFGMMLGLFWGYRLFEIIDAMRVSDEKRRTAPWRYRLLQLLPLIMIIATIGLLANNITDGAGVFSIAEFLSFHDVEKFSIACIDAAVVGATGAVRWGPIADRTTELTGDWQTCLNFSPCLDRLRRAIAAPAPTDEHDTTVDFPS